MAAAPAHQNRVDGQHDHQAGARQHDGQRQDQSAAGVMAGAERLAHGRATVQKRGRICSGTDAWPARAEHSRSFPTRASDRACPGSGAAPSSRGSALLTPDRASPEP